MAITGIDPSSYYSDYYSNATNAASKALEGTLDKVGKTSTDDEMMKACKEFEQYFLEQIYKGMEKTIIKAEDTSDSSMSQYTEYFNDMRVQALAKSATEQGDGIGLAKQLYESMKRNYGL